jgi:hypothetical protein
MHADGSHKTRITQGGTRPLSARASNTVRRHRPNLSVPSHTKRLTSSAEEAEPLQLPHTVPLGNACQFGTRTGPQRGPQLEPPAAPD